MGTPGLQLPKGAYQPHNIYTERCQVLFRFVVYVKTILFVIMTFDFFLKTFEGHDASVLKVIFVSRGTQLLTR